MTKSQLRREKQSTALIGQEVGHVAGTRSNWVLFTERYTM